MTVIQPAFNASNSIIVRLKIDLAVPPSSRLAFLCQTISGEGDIVGAIDQVEPQDGLLTRHNQATHAIASTVDESHLCADYIIHSAFDSSVTPIISKAEVEAAFKTGVARR